MGEGKEGGRGAGGSKERMQLSQQHLWGGRPALPETALPREAPRGGLGAF